MKKLTSLLMLAALTSGALALSEGQSFAQGRTINPAHAVSMQKHPGAVKKSGKSSGRSSVKMRKTRKAGRKSRKGSRKGKKPTVVTPASVRQG